jgi:hypothetical protein
MSEFNLTIGQAIDLLLQDKVVESDYKHIINILRNSYNRVDFVIVNHINSTQTISLSSFVDIYTKFKYREYIEPKPVKMITWYIPSILWCENDEQPTHYGYSKYYKSKDDFFRTCGIKNVKVLKWKEIQAPETWEQCE